MPVAKYVCSECKAICSSNYEFEEHIAASHSSVVLPTETRRFRDEESFRDWKREMERGTISRFSVRSSRKIPNFGSTSQYRCNRDGNTSLVPPEERKREIRRQGPSRINAHCPARFSKTVLLNGEVDVEYHPTHFGHDLDLAHLPLPSPVKAKVAAQVNMKIPKLAVLESIRGSLAGQPVSREHLLTMKDIDNIVRDFHLKDYKLHPDDATSIDAWVKQREEGDQSDVILYIPKGHSHPRLEKDNFLLGIMTPAQGDILRSRGNSIICMDSTHNTTGYGYELTTILVIDEFGKGFPCAFYVSDRNDHVGVEIFLEKVKARVGCIVPTVFMSDLAEVFVNAWTSVMGKPERRLYCTWHVKKRWKEYLKHICGAAKRNKTWVDVQALLTETDSNAFKPMLATFVENMLADEDTRKYGQYFETYYARHSEKWAYCYRLKSRINVNMALERLHGTFKYRYLDGKFNIRMDKMVHALMRLIHKMIFDRLVALQKGHLSSKIKTIRNRHQRSEQTLNFSDLLESNDGTWTVFSKTRPAMYNVEQAKDQELEEGCKCMECRLFCNQCNACIHKYTCTCIDFAVKWNMCKHIHTVLRFLKSKETVANKMEVAPEPIASTSYVSQTPPEILMISEDADPHEIVILPEDVCDKISEDADPHEIVILPEDVCDKPSRISVQSNETVANEMEVLPEQCYVSQTPPEILMVSEDADPHEIVILPEDVCDKPSHISVQESESAKLISQLSSQDKTFEEVQAAGIAEMIGIVTAAGMQCSNSAEVRRTVRMVRTTLKKSLLRRPAQQFKESRKFSERIKIDRQRKFTLKKKKKRSSSHQLQASSSKLMRFEASKE